MASLHILNFRYAHFPASRYSGRWDNLLYTHNSNIERGSMSTFHSIKTALLNTAITACSVLVLSGCGGGGSSSKSSVSSAVSSSVASSVSSSDPASSSSSSEPSLSSASSESSSSSVSSAAPVSTTY